MSELALIQMALIRCGVPFDVAKVRVGPSERVRLIARPTPLEEVALGFDATTHHLVAIKAIEHRTED